MAEYGGNCAKAWSLSKRLSRARFEGVVIKIRGGRGSVSDTGRDRS
jgi:hypothetical protein